MSNCLFEQAFDHADIGLCLVGPDGRVRRANAQFLAAVGLAPRDLDGEPLDEVMGADAEMRALFARALRGETVSLPRRAARAESPPDRGGWWEGRASPFELEGGIGLLVSARDTSARVRRERERERLLQETGDQRRLLEALFQTVSSGLAVIAGPELRFELVNPAYRAVTPDPGLDPRGRRVDEVWPTEAGYRVSALIERVIETGVPVHVDRLGRKYPGSVRRYFAYHLRAIPWGDSQAVLSTVWETTSIEQERARAQCAAAEARRRAAELDATLDSMADALLLYDPSGQVVRMNQAAQRLFGYDEAERRLPLRERIAQVGMTTPEGTPFAPGTLPAERALQGETVRGVVMMLRGSTPSRRMVCVSGSAAPIRDPAGTLLGAIATLTDISRLHDLQDQQEDMLRTISHDLRTPLSVITGQAHLLAKATDRPQEVRRRADRIATSARRMDAMIQDLVDLARYESGQLQLKREPLDLHAVALELKERLSSIDSGRLRLRLNSGLPPVMADPDRLERILVNLITNALKFSPEDSEVVLEAERCEGGAVRLSVTDHGEGIGPEEMPRLFQRFARVRGARQQGIGLGLYIARLLVEAHGGSISVLSRPGEGSSFRVTLPAAAELPLPASVQG